MFLYVFFALFCFRRNEKFAVKNVVGGCNKNDGHAVDELCAPNFLFYQKHTQEPYSHMVVFTIERNESLKTQKHFYSVIYLRSYIKCYDVEQK